MNKTEKKACWLYSLGMVLLVEVFSFFQPIYTNVDNFITSMVVSGVYGEDTYSMVLNPALCWIMAAVSKVFPSADVFSLVTKAVLLTAIGSISYFIALHFQQWYERLFASALLFLLTIDMNLFSDFFMVWAALFSFAGMIWLLRSMQTEVHKSWIAAGTFFLCCGLMWRLGGFTPFIPFLLLGWGMDLLFGTHGKEEKVQYLKKTVQVFGPMLLCFALLLGIDYGYKHSEKYEDSVKFCDAVSSIVDYPMKPYEEVQELLPGVSFNDYESLSNHLYADTERITTEYCLQIAQVGKADEIVIEWKDLLQKTYSLIARLYGLENFFIWCLGLGFVGVGVWAAKGSWHEKLKLLFAVGGAYLMMLYLMLAGRLPERGMQVILYGAMGIFLVAACQREPRTDSGCRKKLKGLAAILFVAAAVLRLPSVTFSGHQSLFCAKTGAEEQKWEATYEADAVYLWRSTAHRNSGMRSFMSQGKLLSQEFLAHHLNDGGWEFNQVYFKERMEQMGVPNPIHALIEQEETYYVAEDCNFVWTYLKEHYDDGIEAIQVDELNGIPVWKFR